MNNVRSAEEQLAPVKIPDILPSTLPLNANFGYAVGDFLEIIAQEPDEWDAIATSFFLDTARNVIEYIQAIWYTLKPGGYWLNIGPLLYHYADSMESSLELTLDQVLHVVRATGFEILEQRSVACHYTAKRSCMMNTLYNAEFWIAKKPVKGPWKKGKVMMNPPYSTT